MNDNSYEEAGPANRHQHEPADQAPVTPSAGEDRAEARRRTANTPKFGFWAALDLIIQRWHWLVLGPCIGGAVFYMLGFYFLKPKFVASAQLIRYEVPGRSEFFKSTPVSADTFGALIRSPDVLRRVGEKQEPKVPVPILTKLLKVDPAQDSDMITVQLAARDPRLAVKLLNDFLQEAVEYTRSLEATQAAKIADEYLQKQVAQMEGDLKELQESFRKMPVVPAMTNQLARMGSAVSDVATNLASPQRPTMAGFTRQAERLAQATRELDDLLAKYTELHPLVQAKQGQVEEIRKQMAEASTNSSAASPFVAGVGSLDPLNPEVEIIHIKLRALEDGRLELLKRQREAKSYADDPPGSVRIYAPADLANVKTSHRRIKIGVVTVFGSVVGLGASLLLVLLVEFVDDRLKTTDDVTRVTRLPLLASLGDLQEMTPEARSDWAFRVWTMLQGSLSPSPNYGLICGVTSSSSGEGRSTWISLLAEAASLTGFRVLTIATAPSVSQAEYTDANGNDIAPEQLTFGDPNGQSNPQALTTSVLSSPAKVTEQLTGPDPQPVVHIPLPGWVWSLDRRKQWRDALCHWSQIENLVILVELPPASAPEAVLLGSNLPNLVWLTDSGKARATQTRNQLETLHFARCNLVGAFLNHLPALPVRRRFPRWLSGFATLIFLATGTLNAQDNPANAPEPQQSAAPAVVPAAPTDDTQTNRSLSIVSPSQRAAWQQHLTLGPGDVLTLNLYGQPELARTEVPIGPDGRISYLEAQDVVATGLSVDELRQKIDQELAKYRRAPRTMITPVAFHSKKYFMLGKVTTKGVYTLDRPLTVIEALARAHGLESALVDRNLVSITDFQRSFIAREGKRIPLSFENLFQRGDLTQNIPVEPGDYIFFAPGDVDEVYVVGEVRLPGPVTFTSSLTIIGAIAERGGFTERAFRARVLVVRGSLNNPEPIPVDTHAITDARAPDFKLRPRDIIYVNSRPLIKLEEAADLAATAFIQSVISSWVGVDVVKPIK